MSIFEYISVAVSLILGLGVTQLLSSAVRAFLARRRMRLHWIPFLWAAGIFITQIQYWWSIYELAGVYEIWRLSYFVTWIVLAMLLFLAGSLVLPAPRFAESGDLLTVFEEDGRWGIASLAAYFIGIQGTNWYFFGTSPLSLFGLQVLALAVVPLAYPFLRGPRSRGVVTALYLPFLAAVGYQASPLAYGP